MCAGHAVTVSLNINTLATAPMAGNVTAVRAHHLRKAVVEAMLQGKLLSMKQFRLLDCLYLAAGPSILDRRCSG